MYHEFTQPPKRNKESKDYVLCSLNDLWEKRDEMDLLNPYPSHDPFVLKFWLYLFFERALKPQMAIKIWENVHKAGNYGEIFVKLLQKVTTTKTN